MIRQISFGDYAQYFPLLECYGTVHQGRIDHNRHTHNRDDVHLAGIVHNLHQCDFGFFQQECLTEQVGTRISGDTQFREDDDLYSLAVGNGNLGIDLLGIEFAVCHLYTGNGSCYFNKTIFHTFLYNML